MIAAVQKEKGGFGRISDRGIPKGKGQGEFKRVFKFRVTFKVVSRGSKGAKESGFSFYDLDSARRCYRDTLLGLYKAKGVESFSICLNRYRSKRWRKPIFIESVSDSCQ